MRVTDRDHVRNHRQGVYLNREAGTECIRTQSAVVHKDSILPPYHYELHCISMKEIPKTFGKLYKNGFYVWSSQAVKSIRYHSFELFLKNTSKEDRSKDDNMSDDDMEILKVPVTDKTDSPYVENGAAAAVCHFILKDYHYVDLVVRIEQIVNPDIPLCDISLSYASTFCASLYMYCFVHSNSTLSAVPHTGVSADHVTNTFKFLL